MKNLFIRIPKTASTSISRIPGITSHLHKRYDKHRWSERHGAYKFTVVREPIDRFVSGYYFLNQNRDYLEPDGRSKQIPWPRDIHQCIDQMWTGEKPVHETNVVYYEQWSFLTDLGGQIRMNKIARYENLEADWALISNAIFGEVKFLPHRNKTVGKRSVLDESDRRKLRDIYSVDYEAFGY